MGNTRICSTCGAELLENALEGLCPRCVGKMVIGGILPGGPVAPVAESSALQAGVQATLSTEAMPVTEKIGDKIGHYKLLQQIGEGGCGVVYMAEQEEPLRRRVAFKVIKLGMDTRQVIARFEAERQALALMDHPNIAKVLDAGATETGRPYFVMELVRGIRITDYCDQNNLSTQERLDLFTPVCHAIQHAHQKGIIHRDIKPSNILVTLHDGRPVPKVIDFGIAKATEQKLTDKTLFTAFEQVIGTPAYMSPEQAEMSGLDIDTRSDIYSLGVLLYELLTGKTPFDAKELILAGLEGMRRMIREKEPVRPSTKISTLRAEEQTTVARRRHVEAPKLIHLVRGDLDWIVMKCLEKDRTRRYPTADGLALDIDRHLKNEPVEARSPSAAYRFRKLVRRNKLAFAAAGAVTAALVLGLSLSTYLFFKERDSRQRAEKAERTQSQLRQRAEANELKAEAEAAKRQQVAQFFKDMLEGVGPSVALGRDTDLLKEILQKTATRVGRDLTNQPGVEIELRATIGTVYRELGAFDEAERMYQAALDLESRLGKEESADYAQLLNAMSQVLCSKSKFQEAEAMGRRALAIQRKVLPPDHADIALTLNNLSAFAHAQGKFSAAEELQREALAMRKRLFKGDHANLAESLDNLASTLWVQDKLAEAETYQREALAMRQRLYGAESPEAAYSMNSLANLLFREGKMEDSESLFRQTLAVRQKVLGPAHPDIGTSLNNLGGILLSRSKWSEAETNLLEGLAMRQRFLGTNHVDIAESLNNLAVLYQRQGRLAEAETTQTEQIRLSRRLLGEHPRTASSLNNLAIVLRDEGKLEQAEKMQREALEMYRKLLGNQHQDVALCLHNLGRVLRTAGRLPEAESCYRQALDIYRAILGADHAVCIVVLGELALTLEYAGKLAEIEAQLRHALEISEKNLTNSWSTFNTRSLMGRCLTEARKYGEAEPLLLSGYAGLKEREGILTADRKYLLKEAARRLVQLYQATDRPDQAAAWKKKLAD